MIIDSVCNGPLGGLKACAGSIRLSWLKEVPLGGVFWINSRQFEARTPRPEAVNEGIGGDELAAWLSARLKAAGLTAEAPWPEDHGWDFGVQANGSSYLISCACEIQDWGDKIPDHSIGVTKMRGFMDRMRGRNLFAEDDAVKAAIAKILAAEPAISHVRWEADAR